MPTRPRLCPGFDRQRMKRREELGGRCQRRGSVEVEWIRRRWKQVHAAEDAKMAGMARVRPGEQREKLRGRLTGDEERRASSGSSQMTNGVFFS